MNFLDQRNSPQINGSNSTNGTKPFPRHEEEGIDKGDVHELMMIIVWMAAGNIGLWSLAFKQYKCAIYVHFFCMSVLNIIVWMSGFMAIMEWGVNAKIGQLHVWLGISLMIGVMLQSIGGATTWLLQRCAKIKPTVIYILNWIHRIFGLILLVLATVQILLVTKKKQNIFIPILVISVVSWVLYLLIRFCRPKMQGYSSLANSKSVNQKVGQNRHGVPLIENSQDLAKLGGEYFIFADQVYDIHNVLANHPGGYQLIRNIKGREVDRYIYGSEPLQAVKKMYLHGHTSNSMKLAGEPLAAFNSTVPFSNMHEINQVTIERRTQPCRSRLMHAPYLTSKNASFPIQFNGYENLSQLGKYFSVTVNNNLTRLYSVVNFLHLRNIQLLSKLSGKNFENSSSALGGEQGQLSQRAMNLTKFGRYDSIPLLIKRYQKGQFTNKLLSSNFRGKIKISKPLGRGLNLHEIPAGQLIFFAAGTGINPFCDIIDLLYKQFLIFQGSSMSNQIIRLNPILQNRPVILNKYLISLFYSVRDTEELNDITAYQLDRLAQAKIVSAYVRAEKNDGEFFRNYRSLGKLERKFEQYVGGLADRLDRISQIYVCGPPSMNADLVKAFGEKRIPNFRYKIL